MKTWLKRVRAGRVCRDAILLASCAGVALVFPIAVGLAISPKDAAAIAEQRDRQEEAKVQKRSQAIEAELKSLQQHPWAGSYYQGDGLGANLRLSLAPKNGIAATWNGCLGLYGANRGSILQDPDGELRFQFERPNLDRFGGFPDHAYPVRWGERRYLLPPSQMLDFVAAINQGLEPRPGAWGRFFLREGDEDKPVAGLPQLPDEFLSRIRNRSLTARVLSVEPLADKERALDMCNKSYRLQLQVVSHDLLNIGEKLQIDMPANVFGDVAVESATPGHATVVGNFLELNCSKPQYVPNRRWVLSTGAFNPVAANEGIEASAKHRPVE